MAVKRCLNCNAKAPLDAPTCPECGATSFRYKCPQCGTIYSGNVCTNCGCPAPTLQAAYRQAPNQQASTQQSAYIQPLQQPQQRSRLTCPKCGSHNISVQAVTLTKTKGKGLVYWLCCIWLFDMLLWLILFIPRLIIALFGHKRVTSKTHSEAVCQDCGKRWKIK